MINLRYHIVSLTAVFLAIGIGLTLGSTFLDRATVENLQGQLQNLETRLGERDEQIDDLESELNRSRALQEALDEQATGLLAGTIEEAPVLVVASEGVDEADLDGAVESLGTSGADVQGLWWLTERFLLAEDADVDDLASALDETSRDPARLRRLAVDALGAELRAHQLLVPAPTDDGPDEEAPAGEETPDAETPDEESPDEEAPAAEETPEDETPEDEIPEEGTTDEGATDEGSPDAGTDDGTAPVPGVEVPDVLSPGTPVTDALVEAGFIRFEVVGDAPTSPTLPAGVRLVLVGGSSTVPDDVFIQPLVERLAQGATNPTKTVVASAIDDGTAVSEAVSAVRGDERLRSLMSTVDGLDHFQGWMATVLAVRDVGEGVVGHYGLGEGASALLPPLRST